MARHGENRTGDVPDPPSDPEAWTDEEWLAWLRATDGAGFGGPDGGEDDDPGTKMSAFTKRPASRALGAAMLGLRNAMYGRPDDEVAVVVDADGDPPGADAPELHDLHLDPEHPERSEVVVRQDRPGRGNGDAGDPGPVEPGETSGDDDPPRRRR